MQNSGGCFTPPPGYFQRVREICDKYGVLLVSDEVICAFGRLGYYFGSERYGYQPDIITFAKGVTSGYSPLGGMIVRDQLMEPFLTGTATFLHGITFAGHPVSAAVALANLDVFERDNLLGNVRANEDGFRATLDKLIDLPIVGDIRGDGYFYGIELVKDKATKETFDDDESERLLRGFLSHALFDAGLVCRADDRGDPVIQLAPPLICTQEHFDEIEQILRSVLTEAWSRSLTYRSLLHEAGERRDDAHFNAAERQSAGRSDDVHRPDAGSWPRWRPRSASTAWSRCAGPAGSARPGSRCAPRAWSRDSFADGCWLVELSALRDPELLPRHRVGGAGPARRGGRRPARGARGDPRGPGDAARARHLRAPRRGVRAAREKAAARGARAADPHDEQGAARRRRRAHAARSRAAGDGDVPPGDAVACSSTGRGRPCPGSS